jgi:anti-sigma B factor antagonist
MRAVRRDPSYACQVTTIDGPSVTFTVERDNRPDGVALLRLTGELDLANTPALSALVDEALDGGWTRILVDLRAATFCDSTGLSAFVRGHHRATAAGGWFRVYGAWGTVARVLNICGLDTLLETDEPGEI